MSTIENESNRPSSPSSKALREEIGKILEEFLIKDLENRKAKISAGQRRNKSDPLSERIRFYGDRKNNGVSHSRTLPDKKLGSSLKSSRELEHCIGPHRENGFVSSGESEGEEAAFTDHPKKKSRFKKAAAIIGHYLKRNKKKNKKIDDTANDQSRKGSETPSVGRTFRASDSTSTDSPRSKRNSIFHSFHKSKSSKRDSDAKQVSFIPEAEVHNKDSDETDYGLLPGITPTPKEITPDKPSDHYASNGTSGTYSRSISSSPADAHSLHMDLRGSSSSTVYPASDLTSTTARSSTSNALDDPGEDIDYMDLELPGGTSLDGTAKKAFGFTPRKMSASRFLDSEGIKNLQLLAQAHMDMLMEQKSKTDGIIFSKIEENKDALDGASSQDKPAEAKRQSSKEELYCKIATKLAELAGSYSTTDHDTSTSSNAAPVQVPLTELEKEIIACIRSEGDRNSAAIEEKFEAFTAQVTEESYKKFKQTIQSSVKQELSWDHLAFVFYTTKAVVSAVGKGTKAATKVKEYTLDYISDTFATWIIDQGGFDSIMSSDSDFEVD